MAFAANISRLVFTTSVSHDLENLVRLYGWTASAVLLSLTSFALHFYRRQQRPTVHSPTSTVAVKSHSTTSAIMTPQPGDVRVSKILIHPIKVRQART